MRKNLTSSHQTGLFLFHNDVFEASSESLLIPASWLQSAPSILNRSWHYVALHSTGKDDVCLSDAQTEGILNKLRFMLLKTNLKKHLCSIVTWKYALCRSTYMNQSCGCMPWRTSDRHDVKGEHAFKNHFLRISSLSTFELDRNHLPSSERPNMLLWTVGFNLLDVQKRRKITAAKTKAVVMICINHLFFKLLMLVNSWLLISHYTHTGVFFLQVCASGLFLFMTTQNNPVSPNLRCFPFVVCLTIATQLQWNI